MSKPSSASTRLNIGVGSLIAALTATVYLIITGSGALTAPSQVTMPDEYLTLPDVTDKLPEKEISDGSDLIKVLC